MDDEFIGLTAGVDANGNPVRLGERDSMGHVVGYIEEDGTPWESLRERDYAVTAGEYRRALLAWMSGDERFRQPRAEDVARATCIDPQHCEGAAQEAEEQVEFYRQLRGILPKRGMGQFLSWVLHEGCQLDSAEDLQRAYLDWLERRS